MEFDFLSVPGQNSFFSRRQLLDRKPIRCQGLSAKLEPAMRYPLRSSLIRILNDDNSSFFRHCVIGRIAVHGLEWRYHPPLKEGA
jgi:hypothetical protein